MDTHHSIPHIGSKLETLDNDSIYLILIALCYTDVTRRLKQLWPLSLTCKRLRELCLPLMFKRVVWPNKRIANIADDIPMLPETLWPYIQNFRFHYDDDYYIDELIEAIPKLIRLSTFSIHHLTTPSDMLIEALFRCPSLIKLSFEETPLDFHLPSIPCETLHTLQFKDGRDLRVSGSPKLFIRSWRESPGRKVYEKIELERRASDTTATAQLLDTHGSFLQHVEIPSGLMSVRDLGAIAWPVLQSLVLTGPCPPPTEHVLRITQAMPALRDLQILYSIHPPYYKHCWCVCPPNLLKGQPTSSALTLATCSPILRSLTLSNPHIADMVFRSIPSSIESLTLLSILEWPHQTVGINHGFATRIMREVSACGARLRELRMFISWEPTIDLINTIVQYFPALEVLHLGIDVWPRGIRQDIDTNDWERYAHALMPLLALRELYLGLFLPESVHVDAFASVFCHRLPTLEVVGMQQVDVAAFYHPARVEWQATYVTRGPKGLEYHDICEPLLS